MEYYCEWDYIFVDTIGGFTEENNLQTLCWKCNRRKGSKLKGLI